MARKLNGKKKRLPIPATLAEAAEYERQIGALIADMQAIELEASDEIAKIEKAAQERIKARRSEGLALAKLLRAFAEKHREELTGGGTRKTIVMQDAGTVRWYDSPSAIGVEDAKTALAWLKENDFPSFIRNRPELNKEELGKHPEIATLVPGIRIIERHTFAIIPANASGRFECNTDTNRWAYAVPKTKEAADD